MSGGVVNVWPTRSSCSTAFSTFICVKFLTTLGRLEKNACIERRAPVDVVNINLLGILLRVNISIFTPKFMTIIRSHANSIYIIVKGKRILFTHFIFITMKM
ncbi:uncharacterized protein LOC119656935 isoform X2 [Hermetia illucens]|uniref:uncharacterized protein LOC119656935 isoform X2 n=1 Tax=Hermetia illucens TaxID=343691 RepID=UPI0018CC421B|nr:uncharacterized protein LOC119656935 isoform X2 [Hermetia illucens]